MWFNILKNDTPKQFWSMPKEKFIKNTNRALGYIMSHWYLENKEEIENWVNSQSHLEGIFIDTGNRSKTYKFGVGGYFIFNRELISEAITNNTELLINNGIPTNVDGLVNAVATQRFNDSQIYNFIADLFGDERRREDNPLNVHRRKAFKGKQRGFE